MKVFVTGVGGQLGYDVMKELAKRGHIGIGAGRTAEAPDGMTVEAPDGMTVEAPDGMIEEAPEGMTEEAPDGMTVEASTELMQTSYVQLDITDEATVSEVIEREMPDAVIHCAAWTAVDMAEEKEYRETVKRTNVDATSNIAKVCKKIDCKLIYVSTDYVFDGQGTKAWEADSKDFGPLSIYGKSKLEGELAVSQLLEKFFIVRTAWVFGEHGKNFVKTMITVGKKYDEVRVVNDQIGTPTYTPDLARLLVDMAESEKYGFYHATNEGGYISWYDFCVEFYRQYGLSTKVQPVTTKEYGLSKAARPYNSRLDKSKLKKAGFSPLPVWQDAVGRYLKASNL